MNPLKTQTSERRREKLLYLLAKSDSDKDFSERVGLAPAFVSQLKLGNRNIGNKVARKIERALGKDDGWFDEPDSNAVLVNGNVVAYDSVEELGDSYQSIPLVDIKAGAGSGGIAEDPRTRMDLAFISGWLMRQGLQPQNLMLIEVFGDSMEPRIFEGDMVLIDTAQTAPRTGGVYAVMTDSWLKIKRLYVSLTGDVELQSDNPRYRTERPDSSLHIVGRCVWVAGSGGL